MALTLGFDTTAISEAFAGVEARSRETFEAVQGHLETANSAFTKFSAGLKVPGAIAEASEAFSHFYGTMTSNSSVMDKVGAGWNLLVAIAENLHLALKFLPELFGEFTHEVEKALNVVLSASGGLKALNGELSLFGARSLYGSLQAAGLSRGYALLGASAAYGVSKVVEISSAVQAMGGHLLSGARGLTSFASGVFSALSPVGLFTAAGNAISSAWEGVSGVFSGATSNASGISASANSLAGLGASIAQATNASQLFASVQSVISQQVSAWVDKLSGPFLAPVQMQFAQIVETFEEQGAAASDDFSQNMIDAAGQAGEALARIAQVLADSFDDGTLQQTLTDVLQVGAGLGINYLVGGFRQATDALQKLLAIVFRPDVFTAVSVGLSGAAQVFGGEFLSVFGAPIQFLVNGMRYVGEILADGLLLAAKAFLDNIKEPLALLVKIQTFGLSDGGIVQKINASSSAIGNAASVPTFRQFSAGQEKIDFGQLGGDLAKHGLSQIDSVTDKLKDAAVEATDAVTGIFQNGITPANILDVTAKMAALQERMAGVALASDAVAPAAAPALAEVNGRKAVVDELTKIGGGGGYEAASIQSSMLLPPTDATVEKGAEMGAAIGDQLIIPICSVIVTVVDSIASVDVFNTLSGSQTVVVCGDAIAHGLI